MFKVPTAHFGRERLRSFEDAERMEWLVSNGIGGYASGTVTNGRSRGYHGLLVAALAPPLGRTLPVTHFDVAATVHQTLYELSSQRWRGGAIAPRGDLLLESFRLEGRTPVWRWALADAILEQRVLMVPKENTTCVLFRVLRGSAPVALSIKAFCTYRDFHDRTHGDGWTFVMTPTPGGVQAAAFEGATAFSLLSSSATIQPAHTWYRDYALLREAERGLGESEDALHFATATATLSPGEEIALFISTESTPSLDAAACQRAVEAQERELLQRAHAVQREGLFSWLQRLVLAADQFVVDREMEGRAGKTVLAGYPWFGDWGRDTMISLPGLALATGRPEIATAVLRTFSHVIDRGMLPNRFPDSGEEPEYNTTDASLWFFDAVRATFEATADRSLLNELFMPMSAILEAHLAGTRYGIGVADAHGLLRAGVPG